MNEQLEKWLNGESVHDHEINECVPDFTCCNGQPISLEPVRQRFCKAVNDGDDKTKFEMLGMFLANAMSGVQIYAAGLDTGGGD